MVIQRVQQICGIPNMSSALTLNTQSQDTPPVALKQRVKKYDMNEWPGNTARQMNYEHVLESDTATARK